MKGIVLAGGSGTRLHPATLVVNKQLLPVYDKPMIYYPLSVLMLAGITEIAIVSSPEYLPDYRALFGDGSALGLRIDYIEQPRPEGLPQAFTLGRAWIAGEPVALILGDNIFYGNGLVVLCRRAVERTQATGGATVFGYHVPDPQRYGVIGFDSEGRVTTLEEKPAAPKSNCAMAGLYVFDARVCDLAAELAPSPRGELEITDLARAYLATGDLHLEQMGRGYAWLDTGTHDSLLEAAEFVRTVQHRQGIQIACLEEIAYHLGLIDARQARALAGALAKSPYGAAILKAIEER
ncbi:MAG TPA: glucose-1-phosphate thymidylyltransferase RfbA [Sphingomonas sp.]|jgi:glucose-1-phosphate thymidylyltransferase